MIGYTDIVHEIIYITMISCLYANIMTDIIVNNMAYIIAYVLAEPWSVLAEPSSVLAEPWSVLPAVSIAKLVRNLWPPSISAFQCARESPASHLNHLH
jgi:CBS-domain-containing membrane protein